MPETPAAIPPRKKAPFWNRFAAFALRSPLLRWTMGGSVMLISVTGRTTGNTYTTPVNYVERGKALYVTTLESRTWWRNLRGGAPVRVYLRGKDVAGRANLVDPAEPAVAAEIAGTRLEKVLQRQGRLLIRVELD